jgi:hypothetical protein
MRASPMNALRFAEFAGFILSVLGLRCRAAITVRHVGANFDTAFTISNSALIIPQSAPPL